MGIVLIWASDVSEVRGQVPTTGTIAGPLELIQSGNTAYTAQDWTAAATAFEAFLANYASAPEAAEAIVQIKPLLALCKIRLADYGAAGQLITECLVLPKLDEKLKDELSFWKGVVLLQVQAYEEARDAFLAYYQTPEFQAPRRVESIVLYGTTYLLESDFAQAATFFEQQAPRLWELNHEAALRAQTLRLHCLMELQHHEAARDLIGTLQPLMDEVTQIVSLHGLTAELGGRFLELGDGYSAIYCLQRVWPAARLLKHQADRVERLKRDLETLRAQPGGESLLFAKKSVLTRIEREQRTFEKTTDFDLGVRMRLGFAYLGLERWREAALVLEQALTLPGDPKQQAQAGLAVIQCWHELKRYDRAVAAADSWLIRFESKVEEDAVARARFLLAQAHYDAQDFLEAALVFEALNAGQSNHELAPEALLMAGLSRMMADENEAALGVLKEVQRRYAQLPLAEDASYWHGMALSFAQQHLECREHLAGHLKQYAKTGRYAPQAIFRRAYARFMLADYEGAISEFDDYLREHPEGADVAEARVLKGDALGSIGELDAALENYAEVDAAAGHWYEEAQFKAGKIFKLRRDYPGLRAHFDAFIQAHPASSRLAEAVYWAGVASVERGDREEARRLYWDAVNLHGNDPKHYGVEDILIALPRLYRGEDERLELRRQVQRERATAEKKKHSVLVARYHWMEGHVQAEENPQLAQADFMMAAQQLDVKRMNPRVICDCADASRAAGSKLRAAELYRDLIKWHPRAIEVEKALAGLGFLAAEDGDWRAALEFFERFEKKSLTPDLAQTVALKKAALLAENRRVEEAIEVYQAMVASPLTPGRSKAEALIGWGDLLVKQASLLPATAYYERVYLGYGKHRDLAARAYLARGRVLEEMGRIQAAAEVYTELRAAETLTEFPEYEEAALRLKVTGPPLPPEPAETPPTEEVQP